MLQFLHKYKMITKNAYDVSLLKRMILTALTCKTASHDNYYQKLERRIRQAVVQWLRGCNAMQTTQDQNQAGVNP